MPRRRADWTGQNRVGRAAPQRRWLAFGMALTCMLATAAAVAFSPAAIVVQDFALIDHIGALCVVAISKLLSPVHRVFEVLVLAGLAVSSIDRFRTWREARRLMLAVEAVRPVAGSELAKACEAAGLPLERVAKLDDSPLPAFTSGAFRPKVFLNARLESLLEPEELISVLAHEAEHVRRRDPLRLSAMRFLSRTFFFLPVMRSLEQHMAEETELRADAAAARLTGVATASALVTLLRHFTRVSPPAISTGLSQHEFIELRIKLLTGQDASSVSRVRPGALLATIGVLGLLWTAAMAELHEATHTAHVDAAAHQCGELGLPGLSSVLCIEKQSAGAKAPEGGGGR